MPVAPLLNASEAVKVFESFGWRVSRQNGSHIIMKPVARGTLRSLIRDAG